MSKRSSSRKIRRLGRRRAGKSLLPPVMRIAHRGASGVAPENTLTAIEKALEIGVDLVEIDLRLTADGHAAVIHDRTVDRTTDGTGLVETLTREDIQRLDAGMWFRQEFKGERIPCFEDVLDLVGRRAIILAEAKTDEVAERAATIIRSRRAQSRVILQSFSATAIRTVNRLDRRIPTAFLMVGTEAALRRKTGLVKRVLKLGANALCLKYSAARPELVEIFLKRAMGFWVWTVDEEAEMRAMIEMGVGGIITNWPDRLNKVLEEL